MVRFGSGTFVALFGIVVVIWLVALVAVGPGAGSQTGAESLAFSVIDSGQHSGYTADEPAALIIDRADDWAALWQQHAGSLHDMPVVNFSTHIVIAVFQGIQPTSGYAITITEITHCGSDVCVAATFVEPAPDDVVSMVLTTPYTLVTVAVADIGPLETVSLLPTFI